jgi:hypothetical protein
MTPLEKAMDVYRREPCFRTFDADLALHLDNGHVFSTPDYFIMGRPVPRDARHDLITDPAITFPDSLTDCWHIYLFAGNIVKAWEVLQEVRWLPWFSFERRNDLRFYRASTMQRLSLGNAQHLMP